MIKKTALYLLLIFAAATNICFTNNNTIEPRAAKRITLEGKEYIIERTDTPVTYRSILQTKFLKAKNWTAGTALTFGASFFTGFIACKAHFSPHVYMFSSSYLSSMPTLIFSATALSALLASGYVFYQGYKLLANIESPKEVDFKKIFTCLLVAGGIITGMAIGSLR